MRALILLMVCGLSSAAAAQTSVEALLDRINSVDREAVTEADCEAQVAQAENLNALDLLHGASVCYAARRPVEGSFLLNAGQVRSFADMALMVPASRADSDVITSLYGVIYFHAGGPGTDEVLREATLRDRFFRLFDGWSPTYSADYSAGWNVRRRPDAAAYQAAIAETKAARRQQLTDIARLLSDDTYYSLHRRFQEVQARNPNAFVEGTPDATLSRDLMRQMDERAAALGIPVYSSNAGADDLSSARFPPATPARDEIVLASDADPTVHRCAEIAERMAIAGDSRVLRVLITRSPEWGILWRADIAGGDEPPERFTCSATTSSSQPMELGDESVPPLPEGGTSPSDR